MIQREPLLLRRRCPLVGIFDGNDSFSKVLFGVFAPAAGQMGLLWPNRELRGIVDLLRPATHLLCHNDEKIGNLMAAVHSLHQLGAVNDVT